MSFVTLIFQRSPWGHERTPQIWQLLRLLHSYWGKHSRVELCILDLDVHTAYWRSGISCKKTSSQNYSSMENWPFHQKLTHRSSELHQLVNTTKAKEVMGTTSTLKLFWCCIIFHFKSEQTGAVKLWFVFSLWNFSCHTSLKNIKFEGKGKKKA